MTDEDPALLETVPRLAAAEVIRMLLEAEGIPCWLKPQRPKKRKWFHMTLGLHQGPCEIWVRQELFEQARMLLDEAREAGRQLAASEEEDDDIDDDVPR